MTKVVALSWLWNTQKSSFLHDYLDWDKVIKEWLVNVLKWLGYKVKVYKETARILFDLLEEEGVYEYQRRMHEMERTRYFEIEKLKEEWNFDIILTDRTYYDTELYAAQNYKHKRLESLDFIKKDPWSKKLYDKVILLNEPTRDSKREVFNIYNSDEFKKIFNQWISEYYSHCLETFRNWTLDWENIMTSIKSFVGKEVAWL